MHADFGAVEMGANVTVDKIRQLYEINEMLRRTLPVGLGLRGGYGF